MGCSQTTIWRKSSACPEAESGGISGAGGNVATGRGGGSEAAACGHDDAARLRVSIQYAIIINNLHYFKEQIIFRRYPARLLLAAHLIALFLLALVLAAPF